MAESLYGSHVMAYKQYGTAFSGNTFHFIQTLFLLSLALFVFISLPVQASNLLVDLPGNPQNISQLVASYYKYLIGAVGILATVIMMFGGLMYIMSAGNASKADNAKTWITSALTGLVLAFASYTILYMINPKK